jgi:hypothetical protein
MRRLLPSVLVVMWAAAGLLPSPIAAARRPADVEYRVAFEPASQLERRLNELAREGFACVALAQPDPGSKVPGVVAILARTASTAAAPPAHRVVLDSSAGMKTALTRNGADGFRLCGVVLDEEPLVRLVAVMARTAPGAWQYDTEDLLRYKESLARLNLIGRDGFAPVAAAQIDNNRVPDMRDWMVVVERPAAGATPHDVTVRSGVGPSGLAKSLNDAGKQGFRVDLLWKQGNDYIAMMSRQTGTSTPRAYKADGDVSSGVHSLFRRSLGDFPYLSSQRLYVMDDEGMGSNELIEAPLPGTGTSLDRLGDDLTRNHGYQIGYAHVGRGRGGDRVVLSVVMTKLD